MPNRDQSQYIARDINFTRWLFRAYLVLLFLVPLPLGSNRPLFWTVFVAAVAALAFTWALGWLLGVARWPARAGRAKWVLLALGGFCTWATLQFALGVSAAWFSTGVFSPLADVQAAGDSLLLSIGLFLLAVLTIFLVRSRRRALMVLYTLVLAGLAQAIYGSLMMLSGAEWGFFAPKQFGQGLATGTFINRNHYANLLVLALSAGVGLLLAAMALSSNSLGARSVSRACPCCALSLSCASIDSGDRSVLALGSGEQPLSVS